MQFAQVQLVFIIILKALYSTRCNYCTVVAIAIIAEFKFMRVT